MGMRHAAARNGVSVARLAVACALVLLGTSTPEAQRVGYPQEEFSARRQQLAATLKQGALVMFGATQPTPGRRFRQDNDFYYLTGNESLNAALLIDAATPGKEILHPVAVTIFGGLISATLLDALITPVLFLRFGQKSLERLIAGSRRNSLATATTSNVAETF